MWTNYPLRPGIDYAKTWMALLDNAAALGLTADRDAAALALRNLKVGQSTRLPHRHQMVMGLISYHRDKFGGSYQVREVANKRQYEVTRMQ